MAQDERRLVYSTDGSLPLPKPPKRALPKKPDPKAPPDDGVVRVGCERRHGGLMTIVYGLVESELEPLCATLKKSCGTGGSAKDGVVTLQGDRRDAVLAYLAANGRRAKRMGG